LADVTAADSGAEDAANPEDSSPLPDGGGQEAGAAEAGSDASRDSEAAGPPDGGYSCSPDLSQCNYFLPASCLDAALPSDASSLTSGECVAACGNSQALSCAEIVMPGNVAGVECYPCAAAGRRPAGFRAPRGQRCASAGAVGRYFAEVAALEAASVHAFRDVRAELARHGAPDALCVAAERAARDEVRHARITASMARRHGGTVVAPAAPRVGWRSLEAFAIHNAVEGCVRETYGALLATVAARRASDPSVRVAMKGIAVDETRHAALAWAVDAWARARLDARANRRIDRALRRSAQALAREACVEPPAVLREVAGVPTRAESLRLVRAMSRAAWNLRPRSATPAGVQ
jgi:hypothetical protein